MSDLATPGDISKRDLARGRNLAIGAAAAPVVLGGVPAALSLILTILLGTTPPIAATIFFLGLIITVIGFVGGLGLSGYFLYRRSRWSYELRERMAARGVKARISGDAKPFRVRLDYYATRQAAAAEVAALKQRGIIGFVTDEPRAKGATHP